RLTSLGRCGETARRLPNNAPGSNQAETGNRHLHEPGPARAEIDGRLPDGSGEAVSHFGGGPGERRYPESSHEWRKASRAGPRITGTLIEQGIGFGAVGRRRPGAVSHGVLEPARKRWLSHRH